MGRHAQLTDAQRAAIADRAAEQVTDTLAEMQTDRTEPTTHPFQRR